MSTQQPSIAIIGAGLSGLACARILTKAGLKFTLYEAADAVGGRVRSDVVDGFTLDRGFQVLLPSYPEARRVLDYEGLKLRPFYRGADLFYKGKFHRLSDPVNHPSDAVKHSRDPFVSWMDKWRTLVLRTEVLTTRKIERRIPEMETEDYLRDFGFSEEFIDRFFRAFFGGVFLEKDLRTSARMFLFLYSMFSTGGAALPAHGMQAIPDQMAISLPPGCLRLNTPVTSVRAGEITLASGEIIHPDHVIVAVSEEVAASLLPDAFGEKLLPARSTTCLYFTTDLPVPETPTIYLDGDGRGPVNSACVLSKISPLYAPNGQHLISASIIGAPSSEELEGVVRDQMAAWFGESAYLWNHLRSYQIRYALPESRQLRLGEGPLPAVLAPGLYRCGDWCEDASINGALISGRRAAEAVIGATAT
ncbi:phytoene dehydrogenase-like protein [Prosthecobacter fusiformis]|uniref:Phytoene dehydrogenase-like protein n=1 Tax=Prosthecobacter fusiformis TaxID=48464 RepID=A0A4R7RY20_9BACT|nr:NAD(P)/FAD-dependent oxidoreductase [Prosthecobacter fusiformis]TDU70800.1 phytoene dehydrogenase-like protein [Prosthecobacter fusiformis]